MNDQEWEQKLRDYLVNYVVLSVPEERRVAVVAQFPDAPADEPPCVMLEWKSATEFGYKYAVHSAEKFAQKQRQMQHRRRNGPSLDH